MTLPASRQLHISREHFSVPPELDSCISRVLLDFVATGREPETLRIFQPSPILAFGPSDRRRRGYGRARSIAQELGFAPVERLEGGHAAVYHGGTIALAWTIPDVRARQHIRDRFCTVANLIADALRTLGVDARVGAVEGEYCPGEFSINAGGRTKIVGLGQRVMERSVHIGGIVSVSDAARIRHVLTPVNDALDLPWDEATAGSIEDELGSVSWDEVANALIVACSTDRPAIEGTIAEDVVARARLLASTSEGKGRP